MNALSMITKAGVPSNKVVVGVSSYGRSFQMTTPGCYGSQCTFTGPNSGATPGLCTQTAGYISDAEIYQIIANDPLAQMYTADTAYASILVYNDTQWVSYMSEDAKASRTAQYQTLNMGGTSDWAIDLENFVTTTPAVTFPPCNLTFPYLSTLQDAIKAHLVPSYCINIYLLNYLTAFMNNSLTTYATYLSEDYDTKFGVFAGYIESQVGLELGDYMAANASLHFNCTMTEWVICCKDCQTDGCQGCDNRPNCVSGMQNTPQPCPTQSVDLPLFPAKDAYQFTCFDPAGFYADILNLYGMTTGWVMFGDLPAGPNLVWSGFPIQNNVVVTNPKDILVNSHQNFTIIYQALADSALNAQFFLYGGPTIDLVKSAIVPVYTLDYVVTNMLAIMNDADKISAAERAQEIAMFVSCALLLVPCGGELLGAAELVAAKAILEVVGTAADVSWNIYTVVQDPSSWYTILFTLLIDLPVVENFGTVFKAAAPLFEKMEEWSVSLWGPSVSDEIHDMFSMRPEICSLLNN
jgi:Glycosyl hydrolases family 18